MLPELWYLPLSPWSLKARCALLLRGVQVKGHAYTPLVGEPRLRLKLRRFTGRVTVPVLFTDSGVLTDSYDIALYAERVGSGPSIIPAAKEHEIRTFNQASERLLAAGRICSMLRVVDTPEAALETLPPGLAKVMGRKGAQLSVAAFNRKYAISPQVEAEAQATLRTELTSLRAALSDGRAYLLNEFSYADVAMGLSLQLVQPLPGSPMGPHSMRAATHERLAAEFADLLAYRDRIHAQHGLLPRAP